MGALVYSADPEMFSTINQAAGGQLRKLAHDDGGV